MNQKEMYEKIIDWLVNSKIRNKDGAVYSWLNPKKEGYIYPEIIGYYTKLFSYLYSVEKKDKFRELAISSADYISSILSKNGSVSRGGIEYVFDTGICLSGMLSLNKINSLKENHKKSIDAMARFIKNALSKKTPAFKEGKPLFDNSKWSLSYSSLLIKTAISLIEYGKYSNNAEYISFTENIVNEIISKTFRGKYFSINEFKDTAYVHPHCYATEGLCFLKINGYPKYSDIIQKSAQWLSEIQNDDGSINNWYNSNEIKEKQGDATAQSIRIWLFEDKIKYKKNIEKAISFLKTLQSPEGGLYYNNNSKDVNSWVSMFASQALYWNINKKVDFDWIV
jgi:Prenyltransferase and squalene oxidase repeat